VHIKYLLVTPPKMVH